MKKECLATINNKEAIGMFTIRKYLKPIYILAKKK